MRNKLLTVVAALGLAAGWAVPAAGGTLEVVRGRDKLVCGVSPDRQGLSAMDRFGRWSGLAVEFCRAVAAAVLGDASKLSLEPVSAVQAVKGLESGRIDLAITESSWTLSRDSEFAARHVDVLLYDGQGFMVSRKHGLASALELSGATICVVQGTRAAEDTAAYFGRQRMRVEFVTSDRWSALVSIYGAGGCTVLAGDLTLLADVRRTLAVPGDHQLLPEVLSKEPIAPAVRAGDDRWFTIVRWVLMALIEAEELGVTRDNVGGRSGSRHEDTRRLLGGGADIGQALGLPSDWARRAIASVGNYGEMFERSLGLESPLQLPRGLNGLWTKGGLIYAVPLR